MEQEVLTSQFRQDMLKAFRHGRDFEFIYTDLDIGPDTLDKHLAFAEWFNKYYKESEMSTKEGKSGQVQDQLNQLEKALQTNGAVLDTLRNKLACVLRVPSPKNVDAEKSTRQEIVSLATVICDLVLELRQQIDTMNYILDRLEL